LLSQVSVIFLAIVTVIEDVDDPKLCIIADVEVELEAVTSGEVLVATLI
jgi:hypothetical protein